MENTKKKINWILIIPVVILVIAVLVIIYILWQSPSKPPLSSSGSIADTHNPQNTKTGEMPSETRQDSTDSPELNITLTPTLSFIAIVIVDNTAVYSGPAETYDVIAWIDNRTALRVLGISPDKEWFFILLPDNRQGWIRIENVEYDFDIDLLPIVSGTPTPTVPYGQGMLVPPHLLGITPASPNTPGRGALALVTVLILLVLLIGATKFIPTSNLSPFSRRLARAIQIAISLR